MPFDTPAWLLYFCSIGGTLPAFLPIAATTCKLGDALSAAEP
jgi:hypothetical protein